MVGRARWTDARRPAASTSASRRFRPGQEEAVGRRAGRPRRARGHAHRRGQVALLPAARAHARRPDARRLAARLAHAGPGRGARARGAGARRAGQRAAGRRGQPARRSTRAAARRAAAALRRARALLLAGLLRAIWRGAASGCSSSTRRTASRSGATTSGPTTSASADAARALGAPGDRGLDGDGHAAGGRATSCARLGLRDPVRVTTGFDRPNLTFAVVRCRDDGRQARAASPRRCAEPGARPAIVYAGTREGAEELAGALRGGARRRGARLPRRPRRARSAREAQRRFMAGEAEVVVATNAFGMGVDKADVRTVVPRDACPRSLEAYYQEAGRAGRDGQPARALLFAEGRDKGLHVFFIERSEVDDALIAAGRRGGSAARRERRALRRRASASSRPTGCEEDAVRAIVGHLARAGVVQPAPSTPDRAARAGARALRRARARRRAGRRRGRGRARALAPVPVDLGLRRGRRVPARRRSCATSATAPAPAPGGVPCCDVCAPGAACPPRPARARGGPARARRRPRRHGDLDDAILEVVEAARARRSGARARSRSCAAAARRSIREDAYDGLPGLRRVRAPARRTTCSARVDALVDAGRPALDRRALTRSCVADARGVSGR